MEQTDLISIIIPAHNAEKYIEKCLASVLTQTYSHLEIILIDDGSTDKTYDIANKIMSGDNRCRILFEEYSGPSAARNLGITYAHGSYITFVDADDYCEKTMIERLYEGALSRNADLTICSAFREEENGNVLFTDTLCNVEDIPSAEWMVKCYTAPDKTWVIRPWGKLYKKELITEVPFHVGKLYEDQFLFADLLGHLYQVSIVNEPLYHYVSHAGSIVNRKKTDKDFDAVRGAVYTFDKIKTLGLTEYLSGAEGKIYAKMLEIKNKSEVDFRTLPSFKALKEEHMERVKILKNLRKLKIKTVIRNILLYHR